MNKITINVFIDSRIHNGGREELWFEINTGPRNLLKAVAEYPQIRSRSVAAYGNVGCGAPIFRINDQEVDFRDIQLDLDEDTNPEYFIDTHRKPMTRTDWANKFLEAVESGKYQADRDAGIAIANDELKAESDE